MDFYHYHKNLDKKLMETFVCMYLHTWIIAWDVVLVGLATKPVPYRF